MKAIYFFIDRPVFSSVISIVILIAGILSIYALPIAQYPQVAPPTVVVSATYPGANSSTVADTVAAPIEEQINGVENMLYMSSQCTNDGGMRLTVTFEVGTNLDVAQVQVQNRVAIAQPLLPQEVQQRGVTVKKSSPDITLVVTLFSPDDTKDNLYMSNYATLQLRDKISRLDGVGDITIFGARDYAMRLWLDPSKLSTRKISTNDVVKAIKEQNIQVAAGSIGGPPFREGSSGVEFVLSAKGRLSTAEEFGKIIVKVGADKEKVYLKDLGRIELGAADYVRSNTLNGKPAVGMGIFQLPGTNSIDTADAIYKRMEELKSDFPPGLDYSIPYDTTLFVRDSLKDVVKTLVEGIGLVVIVVLLFLQNWRAALVPLIAIPVSLIGTFAAMWIAGFSMNNLSLFGLVLAIGIVVDDAIVVVENVERWIQKGMSPREAAHKAMEEVTPAIIAIAFGLSAVFIPVAFIGGITGQFYKQFALTISFSTLLSALNSLTLSPSLAAILLKPHEDEPDLLSRILNKIFGKVFSTFNRCFDKTNKVFEGSLTKVLSFSKLSLFVYLVLIFCTYTGFRKVPTGFIPLQDQGYFFMNLQMPDSTSIQRTEETVAKLSKIADEVPGIKAVFAVSGISAANFSVSSAAGFAFITLDPFSERAGNKELSLNGISAKLSAKFKEVSEGVAIVIPPPPVRGIGNAGGFKMQIQDKTGLGTPQELQDVAEQVMAEAREKAEVTGIFSSYRSRLPQYFLDIDREKAKMSGIDLNEIFQTLQVNLGSFYVNDFNFLGRVWKVMVQADDEFRNDIDDVGKLEVRNSSSEMIPLSSIVKMKEISGPDRIQRYNLYRSAEISGSTAAGFSTGESIAVMEEIADRVLPSNYGFEWTELALQEKLAGGTALLIFPLCILFVWLTHSAEYESFWLSSAIILIVPMCLFCGIIAVWLRGMDNNIFTQIGFIVLAGMSVKNAVLIVEFAKQQEEHDSNLTPTQAVINAATLRLRPILMTSFAFIFGVLPLILATGAGAEMRQALGTVVFWGMIGVTLFGLFLTPVFYKVIRGLTGGKFEHEE